MQGLEENLISHDERLQNLKEGEADSPVSNRGAKPEETQLAKQNFFSLYASLTHMQTAQGSSHP